MRKILVGLLALGSFSSFASGVIEYSAISISEKGHISGKSHEKLDCRFTRTPVFLTMIMGEIEYSNKSEVGLGEFSSTDDSSGEIFTHALATCSSVSILNNENIYLAHNWVGHQDLAQTTSSILSEIGKGSSVVKNAVFLLSFTDKYFSSRMFKKARDEEYNSAICDFKSKYPESNILVIKSHKSNKHSGSDSFVISRKSDTSVDYIVERDRREGGVIELLKVNYSSSDEAFRVLSH